MQPPVRRTTTEGSYKASTSPAAQPGQVLHRASPREGGPVLRRTPSNEGAQVLRRTTPQQGVPVLRRSGPTTGRVLGRTRGPGGDNTRSTQGRRPQAAQGSGSQRQGAGAGARGGKGPDRRRRLAPRQEEDEGEREQMEQDVDEYIEKHIDPPPNPTEFLPYDPTKLSLEDLKADWPNTPLSTSGMTESVVQKIEWLARRLPHGYQSPEQIAEHYLKGNLTRFESDEERETVIKLASKMSAKTKADSEAGLLHKHEPPRFQTVEDPAFTSLSAKSAEKNYLVDAGVKGDYGEVEQQRYPFMQNAARLLNNNETYGPAQAQKLLNRIQALMPQGRVAPGKQAKQA